MKRLTLLLLPILFAGCQKSGKNISSEKELPVTFYQHLRGTIGEDSVLFDLSVNGHHVTGYCQIPGQDDLMRFFTDSADREAHAEWVLAEAHDNRIGEAEDSLKNELRIRWTGTGFEGIYLDKSNDTELNVSLEEDYSDGAIRFNSELFSDSLLEVTAKYFGSRADISVQILKPVHAESWLINLLAQMRGDSSGIPFDSITPRYRSSFFDEFRTTRNEMAEIGNRAIFYYSNAIQSIRFNHRGFLIVDSYESGYTGGAHGNYQTNLLCVDLEKKQKMKLEDILDISEDELQTVLETAAHDQLGLAPSAPLSDIFFENELQPSQNFGFTEEGLYFLYNPYEVAPYVVGQIWIYLPYNQIGGYLRPEFKRRLKLP